MSLVSALLASAVIASISPSFAAALCRAEGTRYPTKNPVAAGKRIISEAESIVRAVAVRALPDSAAHPLFGPFIRMPLIEFEVREVLKGKGLPRMLHILGHLTDRDDFNRSEVPYSVVRPSAHRWMCQRSGQARERVSPLSPNPKRCIGSELGHLRTSE